MQSVSKLGHMVPSFAHVRARGSAQPLVTQLDCSLHADSRVTFVPRGTPRAWKRTRGDQWADARWWASGPAGGPAISARAARWDLPAGARASKP